MAKKKQSIVKNGKASIAKIAKIKIPPRSGPIAELGIYDAHQFANVMSAMMTDALLGNLDPAVGNMTCNAGGKLLKIVELQHKYGMGGGILKLAAPR